ncbi:hypothetical protein L6164_026298 [Bauhinia variegata]|uniref:Uncharacterized protein n=1 Tax=Bauhinia variegata TaxID=167791 RepID=A0ACB9LPA0_BAUVA|nr:hypothetical protein L6164_026298 [Bauhinia variegata]
MYGDDILMLEWLEPYCGFCELKGMNCKFKEDGINGEIECSPCPNRSLTSRILIAAGPIFLVVLAIALLHIYKYFKAKGKDQARIEIFLEDYRSQKPTRLTYADIKRITNGFMDKLGEGAQMPSSKWHPANCPSIRKLKMLEGEGGNLRVPPNPFDSTSSTSTSSNIPARHMQLELEVIQELE